MTRSVSRSVCLSRFSCKAHTFKSIEKIFNRLLRNFVLIDDLSTGGVILNPENSMIHIPAQALIFNLRDALFQFNSLANLEYILV